jgi:hypothetical protein
VSGQTGPPLGGATPGDSHYHFVPDPQGYFPVRKYRFIVSAGLTQQQIWHGLNTRDVIVSAYLDFGGEQLTVTDKDLAEYGITRGMGVTIKDSMSVQVDFAKPLQFPVIVLVIG